MLLRDTNRQFSTPLDSKVWTHCRVLYELLDTPSLRLISETCLFNLFYFSSMAITKNTYYIVITFLVLKLTLIAQSYKYYRSRLSSKVERKNYTVIFWSRPFPSFSSRELPNWSRDCPTRYSNCQFIVKSDNSSYSMNLKNLPRADATVFYLPHRISSKLRRDVEAYERHHGLKNKVLRVLFSLEAPKSVNGDVDDFFHLFMSYRRDSDIYYPYVVGWGPDANLHFRKSPKLSESKKLCCFEVK